MDTETKEKIKLTAKEILMTLLDVTMTMQDIFGYRYQRREVFEYRKWRETDKNHYYKKIWELEKRGYIKKYKKDKKTQIKLTAIGKKKALKYLSDDYKIKIPNKWDKKWRIVIFDIPEDKKNLRDAIRAKLKKLGFFQLQKSVFVFPFDCQEVISIIKYIYSVGKNVQIIIADSIESETDLIGYFYDQNILSKNL